MAIRLKNSFSLSSEKTGKRKSLLLSTGAAIYYLEGMSRLKAVVNAELITPSQNSGSGAIALFGEVII